jgi:hypothetical protein
LTPGPIRKSPQDITQASKVSPVKRLRLTTSSAPCILLHGSFSDVFPQKDAKDNRGSVLTSANGEIGNDSNGQLNCRPDNLPCQEEGRRTALKADIPSPKAGKSLQEVCIVDNDRYVSQGPDRGNNDRHAGFLGAGTNAEAGLGCGGGVGPATGRAIVGDAVQPGHFAEQPGQAIGDGHGTAQVIIPIVLGGGLNLVLTPAESMMLETPAPYQCRVVGPLGPDGLLQPQSCLSPAQVDGPPFTQTGQECKEAQRLPTTAPSGCGSKEASYEIEPTLFCATASVLPTLPPTQVEDSMQLRKEATTVPSCPEELNSTPVSKIRPEGGRSQSLLLPTTLQGEPIHSYSMCRV